MLFLSKGPNGPVSCSLAVCMTLTFTKVALACRSHFLLPDLYKTYLCADEIETSTSSQTKPRAFEILKTGSGVQIPAPLGPKWYSNAPPHRPICLPNAPPKEQSSSIPVVCKKACNKVCKILIQDGKRFSLIDAGYALHGTL